MTLYGVVTMDIVGSRNIREREQFQDKLNAHIACTSQKYADMLVAPITITSGDEWQVITCEPSRCYDIVHEFQQLLWMDNVDIYAGIGIGGLSTSIYTDIRMMDGPCFHMAREAVNIAKGKVKTRTRYIHSRHNRVYFLPDSRIKESYMSNRGAKAYLEASEEVAVASEPLEDYQTKAKVNETPKLYDLVNLLIENNEALKYRMTRKQKKIYIDYIKWKSYRKMIKMYGNDSGETVGGISQKLNSAEYFTIQRNHEMVKLLLGSYR